MNNSFGIYASPSSIAWNDIRKGPPLEAVREHLHRVFNFAQYRQSQPAQASMGYVDRSDRL